MDRIYPTSKTLNLTLTMRSSIRLLPCLLLAAIAVGLSTSLISATLPDVWARDQLQAWCIVPYDSQNRTPIQRAKMLHELGIKAYAYDFREVHIPTFDEEADVMKAEGIEIIAWWFPRQLNETARKILGVIERHGIKPDLWVSLINEIKPADTAAEQTARVQEAADRIRPIATEARRLGLRVGLYNHGGWFGDPDNELLVMHRLQSEGFNNIGLVYNFHHAHPHIRNFDRIWPRISADVLAVNLNGMVPDGDRNGRKIMYLNEGTEELEMIRIIRRSGWRGRVGIVSHLVDYDAAKTLARNLAGYEQLLAKLTAEEAKASKAEPK